MNPQVQSSNTTFFGNATSTTVPKPSGLVVGDLFFIFAHTYTASGVAFVPPAGYTIQVGAAAGNYAISGFYKIMTSGDIAGAAPAVTITGPAYGDTIGIRITNFDPANPCDSSASAFSSGTPFTFVSAVSVTPSRPLSTVLFSYGEIGSVNSGMGNSGDTAFGNPEGTVTGIQNWVQSSPSLTSGTAVYDYRTTTASTGGFSCTPASNFADWIGTLVVVNPLLSGAKGNFLELL